MKAMKIYDYGDSGVFKLEEVEKPTPGTNELLVRVKASSVNPVDWKLRSGLVRKRFDLAMPCILGSDLSGVVEATGTDVSSFKVADEIFAMVGLKGAYAEYVCIPESLVALKPETMNFVEAGTVPVAALTAWQGLIEQGKIEKGQKVLVNGAAGGVGSFAVQIAKALGAYVVATASRKNSAYMKELGADEVIDFRDGDTSSQVIDLAIDMLGGDAAKHPIEALVEGGRLVQVAPGLSEESQQLAASKSIEVLPFMVRPDGEQLAAIAELIDKGEIKSRVEAVFPFNELGKAQDLSMGGHVVGKVAVSLEDIVSI